MSIAEPPRAHTSWTSSNDDWDYYSNWGSGYEASSYNSSWNSGQDVSSYNGSWNSGHDSSSWNSSENSRNDDAGYVVPPIIQPQNVFRATCSEAAAMPAPSMAPQAMAWTMQSREMAAMVVPPMACVPHQNALCPVGIHGSLAEHIIRSQSWQAPVSWICWCSNSFHGKKY